MRSRAITKVLGVIVALTATTKLPSLLYALAAGEATARIYAGSFALSALVGFLMYWPNRAVAYELRLRDGFLIVTLSWVSACLASAMPLMYGPPYLSFTHAMFEVMSGLTTTGATVISGLDALPRSVLLYRQVLQFLGGMGIVILAVAILPMLKVGGTQLFRAETTGPSRDSRLTPRIAETAKALWLVYAGLTLMCAGAFWVAGMGLFDAVCHALSTVSTGGFSTHDAAFDHWDSGLLDVIAIVFMGLGGVNFALHFTAWRNASFRGYFQDPELRAYVAILAGAAALVTLVVWTQGSYPDLPAALRNGAFMTVSAMTTTGFTVAGFDAWPSIAPLVIMLVAIVGGCSGSTVGGLKVARVLMVLRQGVREVHQLVHPRGQFLVRMGGRRVPEGVVLSVSGFITLWMACFVALVLCMMLAGLDLVSAFGGTVATMANLGPGLGTVTYGFGDVSDATVWLGTFGMLLGRLEVFSVLVLFTPMFWRE